VLFNFAEMYKFIADWRSKNIHVSEIWFNTIL